jgi:hypothetical protein
MKEETSYSGAKLVRTGLRVLDIFKKNFLKSKRSCPSGVIVALPTYVSLLGRTHQGREIE